MNCEQANSISLVDWLASEGHYAQKLRGNDRWYHSPLRAERTPSFKVNTLKNTWYDFGIAKGGKLVDLVCMKNNCSIEQALSVIAAARQQKIFSFPPQKNTDQFTLKSALQIIHVSEKISDMVLRRYLSERKISLMVAEKHCQQVHYRAGEKNYRAIGFKNNAGGYELRSPNFKGSSSPKFVSYFDHGAKTVQVFEGFFDFLSFESLSQKNSDRMNDQIHDQKANILVLNSLSFFTRSLLLMEKHERIHLFLDNDKSGEHCVQELKQRAGTKVSDERSLYKGFKDFSDWWIENRSLIKPQKGIRL